MKADARQISNEPNEASTLEEIGAAYGTPAWFEELCHGNGFGF